jgi:hypothetical protein
LQRFANRELLSLRRLQQIRQQHVEDEVNKLVQAIGEKAATGQLIEPIEMLSHTNAMIMFRAIFARNQHDTIQFAAKREALLEFVFWVFRNASAANPADYIPWLKLAPNNTLRETERQKAVRDSILNSLIDGVRARPDHDPKNPTSLIEVMLAKEEQGEIDRETILLLILANRQDLQRKIHQELDRVIGKVAEPTPEDRDRLPYLNAAILENMCYRTVGPLGLPHKILFNAFNRLSKGYSAAERAAMFHNTAAPVYRINE